jgi:hypothetical protein
VEIVLRLSVACELSNANKSHFKTKFKSNTGGERDFSATRTQDGPQLESGPRAVPDD